MIARVSGPASWTSAHNSWSCCVNPASNIDSDMAPPYSRQFRGSPAGAPTDEPIHDRGRAPWLVVSAMSRASQQLRQPSPRWRTAHADARPWLGCQSRHPQVARWRRRLFGAGASEPATSGGYISSTCGWARGGGGGAWALGLGVVHSACYLACSCASWSVAGCGSAGTGPGTSTFRVRVASLHPRSGPCGACIWHSMCGWAPSQGAFAGQRVDRSRDVPHPQSAASCMMPDWALGLAVACEGTWHRTRGVQRLVRRATPTPGLFLIRTPPVVAMTG